MPFTDYMSCNVENLRNYVAFISGIIIIIITLSPVMLMSHIIGEQVVVIFMAKLPWQQYIFKTSLILAPSVYN